MLGIISVPTVASEKAFGSVSFASIASLNQISNCKNGFGFRSFISKPRVVYLALKSVKSKIYPLNWYILF